MKKMNVIVVFDNKLENTLMCKRTKEPYMGMYNLVGGKIEKENDGLNEAYRELEEETSLIAKGLKLICVSDDMTDTSHYVTAGFLVNCYEGEIKAMEPETILEWKWFDIDNLPENMYKPSKVVIEKYLNNIIYE